MCRVPLSQAYWFTILSINSFKKHFGVRWVVAREHHGDSSLPASSCINSEIRIISDVERWASWSHLLSPKHSLPRKLCRFRTLRSRSVYSQGEGWSGLPVAWEWILFFEIRPGPLGGPLAEPGSPLCTSGFAKPAVLQTPFWDSNLQQQKLDDSKITSTGFWS